MISKKEFFNQFNSGQNQYTYFILAIDASGIAFALNKIDEKVFAWSLVMFAIAILCWAISFFSGLRFQQLKNEYYLLEFKNMDMRESDHPETMGRPNLIDIEEAKLNEQAKVLQKKMHVMYNLLNYLMLLGIIFFVVYEVWEMIIRSTSN